MNLAAAAAVALAITTTAVSPGPAGQAAGPALVRPTLAQAVARPAHAVLRYNAATTESCRSLSDTSSEVCLLLAINIIEMAQRPLASTVASN